MSRKLFALLAVMAFFMSSALVLNTSYAQSTDSTETTEGEDPKKKKPEGAAEEEEPDC